MRRIQTVLIVFSILVMAQSVVAVMPNPGPSGAHREVVEDLVRLEHASSTTAAAIGVLPASMNFLLLLSGLAGLTLAGNRSSREQAPSGRR